MRSIPVFSVPPNNIDVVPLNQLIHDVYVNNTSNNLENFNMFINEI